MTIPSFATEQEAIAWMEARVDDPCVDNHRIGYMDDPASMAAYGNAKDRGCCGDFDEEVEIAGRRALIGCNFGH